TLALTKSNQHYSSLPPVQPRQFEISKNDEENRHLVPQNKA
ncbi:unnamed protein product, partial [Rotaria socialis]